MAYAKYNYNGATTHSAMNLLSDVVSILTGQTTKANLTGKWIKSPTADIGITNASLTVTWSGALTDVTCSVGQTVSGVGIPAGATIATITDGTGFTLNTAHEATATNTNAILILGNTATLPTTQIGSTDRSARTITSFAAATDLFTLTAHRLATGEEIVMTHTGGTSTDFGTNGVSATYYVKYVTANTFGLCSTFANALAGTNIVTAGTVTGITEVHSMNSSYSVGTGSAVVYTAETSYLGAGQTVAGIGIPASTTIVSVSSGISFTMNNTATASVQDATLVFAPGSALCDTANTVISASIASAGWLLHDQYPGTGYVVLKAPVADDSTFFKYVMLDVSNVSYLQMYLYENWSNTTHVGTNLATIYGGGLQQRITTTVSASMLIFASARFIAMQSTTAAGIGSSTNNAWTGIFERSRLAPWDTVANGYPPALISSGVQFGYQSGTAATPSYSPRFKNPAGGDFTTTSAGTYPCLMGWSSYLNGSNTGASGVGTVSGNTKASSTIKTKVPDGNGGFYTPFNEIQYRNPSTAVSFEGGSISTICDVWNTVSYPNNLDEVTKGANTYVILQNTDLATATGYTLTEGESSANTLFPKG